jgi:hypothetical protein
MGNRYNAVMEAIAKGRKLTKDMITGDPADARFELPPMQDEPGQSTIDAEQARIFRDAVEEQMRYLEGRS